MEIEMTNHYHSKYFSDRANSRNGQSTNALKKTMIAVVAISSGSFLSGCVVADQRTDHPMQTLANAKWSDAPPLVPPGAKIVVLDGNPGGDGTPYAVWLKFPARYRIPPHSHPNAEHVTVLQGTLFLGIGEKFDQTAGQPLPVGGFTTMPTGMNHYAYTANEVVILLHGLAPIDFNYVNPADDPRHKPQ
jgi:quercetin dioxygenase-like cupin family protein